ncbi:MAG: hypothetical protein GY805_39735 [Chloroflexi bacterium]|nr:hypothetical protein [Chloroflexota bacterium]
MVSIPSGGIFVFLPQHLAIPLRFAAHWFVKTMICNLILTTLSSFYDDFVTLGVVWPVGDGEILGENSGSPSPNGLETVKKEGFFMALMAIYGGGSRLFGDGVRKGASPPPRRQMLND